MDILTRRLWPKTLAFPVLDSLEFLGGIGGISGLREISKSPVGETHGHSALRVAAAAYSGGTVQASHLLPQPGWR